MDPGWNGDSITNGSQAVVLPCEATVPKSRYYPKKSLRGAYDVIMNSQTIWRDSNYDWQEPKLR